MKISKLFLSLIAVMVICFAAFSSFAASPPISKDSTNFTQAEKTVSVAFVAPSASFERAEVRAVASEDINQTDPVTIADYTAALSDNRFETLLKRPDKQKYRTDFTEYFDNRTGKTPPNLRTNLWRKSG